MSHIAMPHRTPSVRYRSLRNACIAGAAFLLWHAPLHSAPAEENTIEVVELQYRSAADLIPVLEPLVGDNSAITGRGSRLLIRAPAAELAQIRNIIAQLDRAPRNLLITVEQTTGYALAGNGGEFNARAGGFVADIPAQEAAARQHDQAESGASNFGVRTRVHSTRRADDGTLRQSIRVLEGHDAFIATGQDVPTADATQIVHGSTIVSTGSIDYRTVQSGFLVLPRVNGEVVTLTITPQRARLSAGGGGIINTQMASTTVSGKLGEWIDFGAEQQSERKHENTLARSTARDSRTESRLRFRVTLIGP